MGDRTVAIITVFVCVAVTVVLLVAVFRFITVFGDFGNKEAHCAALGYDDIYVRSGIAYCLDFGAEPRIMRLPVEDGE
jgi:hypothetical protein